MNISLAQLPKEDIIKRNGVVYTPSSFASYIAWKTISYFIRDKKIENVNPNNFNDLKVIDPACGDGELLVATWIELLRSVGVGPSADSVLCGVDIDEEAIIKTKQRVAALSTGLKKQSNLLIANAFFPLAFNSSLDGWNEIKKNFGAEKGFDIVIANPPWGADLTSYKDKLNNFLLSRGQIDSSDLFLEVALSIVKDGGLIAFIIPDSIFNAERSALRQFILQNTEIKFIGRFGEKIFDNVNRACAVLICRKTIPKVTSKIDCLRLMPELRKRIMDNEISFQYVDRFFTHKVAQKRFYENKDFLFDIDAREEEEEILGTFDNSKKTLRNYVTSTRGIEISKSGRACKCSECNHWLPFPTARQPKCSHCGFIINPIKVLNKKIISSSKIKGYKPILVGASIKRYNISSRYWIKTNVKGINYKNNHIYSGPKILIRKTGVGISATIDYDHCLTNQVVYIFKLIDEKKSMMPLELLLAIINSRIMYYFLVKNYGETEWKSHPYLTQNQILDLPLPVFDLQNHETLFIRNEIVRLVRFRLKEGKEISVEVDAKIERLIAKLFNFSQKHYEFIYKTLNTSEELLPVRELKRVSLSDIFNSR